MGTSTQCSASSTNEEITKKIVYTSKTRAKLTFVTLTQGISLIEKSQ